MNLFYRLTRKPSLAFYSPSPFLGIIRQQIAALTRCLYLQAVDIISALFCPGLIYAPKEERERERRETQSTPNEKPKTSHCLLSPFPILASQNKEKNPDARHQPTDGQATKLAPTKKGKF